MARIKSELTACTAIVGRPSRGTPLRQCRRKGTVWRQGRRWCPLHAPYEPIVATRDLDKVESLAFFRLGFARADRAAGSEVADAALSATVALAVHPCRPQVEILSWRDVSQMAREEIYMRLEDLCPIAIARLRALETQPKRKKRSR